MFVMLVEPDLVETGPRSETLSHNKKKQNIKEKQLHVQAQMAGLCAALGLVLGYI